MDFISGLGVMPSLYEEFVLTYGQVDEHEYIII